MHRSVIIAMGAMLVVTGCSSGAGVTEAPAAPAAPGATADASPAATGGGDATGEPSVNPDDPLGFGEEEATAVVIIDGQRYEFANLYCVNIGGAMSAASVGGDPKVDFGIPPEDWETSTTQDWDPPSIRLQVDEPRTDYRAGGDVLDLLPDFQPGMSQVDSFTTDGYRASGSATFVEISDFGADLVPISGTFEVSCPRP